MVCTRKERSRYGASSARTQRIFSPQRFSRSFPDHKVTTVIRRASCSEIITMHPANPVTSFNAPVIAAGIVASARCASWGLATNSTLSAVTRGTFDFPLRGCCAWSAVVWRNGYPTCCVTLEYRAGLAKIPPICWPTLGRGEAHSGPFRAGLNAPIEAHGDRGVPHG